MAASNTKECFSEFVGMKFIGVLFNALPLTNPALSFGNKTLIFEDGRGLTISENGSYWIDNKENVSRAVYWRCEDLNRCKAEMEEMLELARQL